jgi:NAD dependent epimerase/dehydratase family enzyme
VWNATAPNPVTNREFARTLGRVLGRPAFIPAPGFALRALLGEFATFLLTGARVLPARAEAAGFRFAFTELEPALRDLLRRSG